MKKAIFIGYHDKTDLLFYLAKTLSAAGRKVLIVDATAEKRYEFAYPALDIPGEPQEYDGFDVWIPSGTRHAVDLGAYEFVLYDTDDPGALKNCPSAQWNFLVGGYEQTSIRRNVRLLESFFADKPASELCGFYKILFEASTEPGEAYIDELLERFPIDWKGTFAYYPDERNMAIKIGNQYAARLKMKGLSAEIKRVVQSCASALLELDERGARKLWKTAERSR
ncbi:hypothetical protein QWJ34_23960 [Saccharibacillus sp. CPCC 101409]|uniref:hypothetical protein n=1 Tax=Saccharibacillus sp. CPCC 101409 TaxID=3058041 RepID=UPI002672AA61|nr:hypothetical protein [Saccharibacillus sp. CPCC 101409]MDO3412843.1 hypothetical protein [Saccharibacillus sp. CPCC 101409]